jgi:hypothetical protein
VLPYIIVQKAEKQARKTIAIVPLAGSAATGVYSLGRNLYKRAKGTNTLLLLTSSLAA